MRVIRRFLLILVVGLVGLVVAPAWAAPALFTWSPSQPLTGQTITFTSTAGPGAITWDLDDDAACDDASGSPVTYAFQTAGVHSVRICVDVDATIQRQNIMVLNR